MDVKFNPNIHQSKDDRPLLKKDGGYKLKTDWKKHVADRQGNKYNESFHGELKLDSEGYLEAPPTIIKKIESTLNTEITVEKATDPIEFNKAIHLETENGDPLRNDDGSIKLKENWKNVAVDRQGRAYNKHVHGDELTLDNEGFIKVRRRGETNLISATNRTEAFTAKYFEEGYAFRIFNDDGGRLEQAAQADWEVVMDENGRAEMNVGQARSPNTKGVLMRKPKEWYEADQKKKHDLLVHDFKSKTAPKEELGQYAVDATPPSPLR